MGYYQLNRFDQGADVCAVVLYNFVVLTKEKMMSNARLKRALAWSAIGEDPQAKGLPSSSMLTIVLMRPVRFCLSRSLKCLVRLFPGPAASVLSW